MVDNTECMTVMTNFIGNPLEAWELNWLNRRRLSSYVSCVWYMYMHVFACIHNAHGYVDTCMCMWMPPMSLLTIFNCVCMCECMHRCMDTFLDYFPPCFIKLCLSKSGVYWVLRLAGQWASGICLSLALQCWGHRCMLLCPTFKRNSARLLLTDLPSLIIFWA